jgi:glycine/D-amino acid oxidase-like deaminating enzyme
VPTHECEDLVVGGGFYGCMIACHLRRRHAGVWLLEKGPGLLGRASYANQARVHQGYHYPRSLLTGFRSRVNYARFLRDFAPCVFGGFDHYYAVGRNFSKVTAEQFRLFCRRIGAPLDPAPAAGRLLFDPSAVEAVFRAEEVTFDAARLRELLRQRLAETGVRVEPGTEVRSVEGLADGSVLVHAERGGEAVRYRPGRVFLCTYSQLNQVLAASRLPAVPLKHELAEMALVRVPDALRAVGITVMCGPFFSLLPFPPEGLHTLSHVRYTPHGSWLDGGEPGPSPHELFQRWPRHTAFERMRRDAARYVPALADVTHERSLWEVKTVLPANEADDGRPILCRACPGLPAVVCVLGAKLDNVYDVLEQLDAPQAAEVA